MEKPNQVSAHTGSEHVVDLEKLGGRRMHNNEPPPELLADDADAELLGNAFDVLTRDK